MCHLSDTNYQNKTIMESAQFYLDKVKCTILKLIHLKPNY